MLQLLTLIMVGLVLSTSHGFVVVPDGDIGAEETIDVNVEDSSHVRVARASDLGVTCFVANLGNRAGCTFDKIVPSGSPKRPCVAATGACWGFQVERFECGDVDCFCNSPCNTCGVQQCGTPQEMTADGYSLRETTRCSTTCGVGTLTERWRKTGSTDVNCQRKCCCRPCPPSGHGGTPQCTEENGKVGAADYRKVCSHVSGP